jgi:hypothetical protein
VVKTWLKIESHNMTILNSKSTPQKCNGGDVCNEHQK